jgi:ribosomal protein S6
MIEYELFYLIGESQEGEKGAITARVQAAVEGEGGTFLAPATEEKRKLAYEIQKETRGTFIARRFTLPGVDDLETERGADETHPLEKMNRALQLDKGVLRAMIVRADDLPELKPIERVEKPRTDRRGYEKRGGRMQSEAPVPTQAPTEEQKAVTVEAIDEQLKDKLDI